MPKIIVLGAGMVGSMLDYYDRATNTTAFPCAIVARIMMNGEFYNAGVHPPESIGKVPGLLDKMLKELEGRDVAYLSRVEDVE